MAYFKTKQGIRIFYDHVPRQGKPTLVFIHGLGCDSEYWTNYIRLLSRDYGIVLVDLRGYGRSDKPEKGEDYRPEKFGEDIIELLSFLKLKHYFIVGHSLGSTIAFDVAKREPSDLSGIISISGVVDYKDLKPMFLLQIYLTRFIPFSQKIFQLLQSKKHFSDETNKVLFCIKCLARNHASISRKVLANLKRYSPPKKNNVPVLTILFDRDEIVKNTIGEIYSQHVEVLHGRHITFLTSYEKIAKKLRAFVAEQQQVLTSPGARMHN